MRTRLTAAARRQWKLPADPWEVRAAADVWLGRAWRDVAEAMALTAESGGMLAVVGESGSGKSTLRRYVIDRLRREGRPVKVVEPQTMDRSRLTASAICDAIILDVSLETPRRTLEHKARQARRVLAESARSGLSHVLIIEEAHDLAIPTVKYLKRVWELEDGFTRLCSVILLAQPEMRAVLDESAHEVREVVRRLEVLELPTLDAPGDLEGYLAARIGERAFSHAAHAAIRKRLSRRSRAGRVSTACPLAVNNLVTRALNLSAEMELERVDENVIAAL